MAKTKFKKETIFKVIQIILFMLPLLICILMFTILPIADTFSKSLQYHPYESNQTITTINFKNYEKVFIDPDFPSAILNSTMVLILGTSISILLAFGFAIIIETLILKTARNVFLSLIYSQFFISSFAVGVSFIFLFGPKNVFFRLFGFDGVSFTTGSYKFPIWVYYSLFQIWRSLPFNLILFASAINKANAKYFKLMKNDNIRLFEIIRHIYIKEVSKIFFTIIFTNFIFASLLYPQAILDQTTFDFSTNKAHTITSFVLDFMGADRKIYNPQKAYAAAFFGFIYLLFLLLLMLVFRPANIKRIIFKLKTIRSKRGSHV
ncbi:carbohydrate ABC transporter permease [Mycoplasma zalophidermidis]|uniref:carbohydrate ABC transporter permease n=1 Tax=Mycoplasma zalophidermidis TaxID=398174 RepID=UPI001C11F263|nr:sugar ABC transporter permease [Mycoplasma zalophidermidis]MBU4689629.1 sugar ABC transporter permease [Mycoplasma zalophidermidis]MCR8966513.1 sugar ABC transporter permease [Mycoplasma zalophidermidis]